MADEPTPIEAPVTKEEPPEGSAPVAAPAPAPEPPTPTAEVIPAATTPNWQEELDRADAKALRSHPKIAGILGSERQRVIQETEARIQAEAKARADEAAQENLRRLAQEDPVSFAEQWMGREKQQELDRKLDELKANGRTEMAAAVGRSFRDVAEWANFSETDHAALQQAVLGKSDDEVIPAFTKTALDLVAKHRAEKMVAEWKAKELPKELAKEREATKQEEAAKRLKESDAPDLGKPKGAPGKFDVLSMSDEDFDKFWQH